MEEMKNGKLTPLGKIFFASLVSWIFGKKLNIKIKGNQNYKVK